MWTPVSPPGEAQREPSDSRPSTELSPKAEGTAMERPPSKGHCDVSVTARPQLDRTQLDQSGALLGCVNL